MRNTMVLMILSDRGPVTSSLRASCCRRTSGGDAACNIRHEILPRGKPRVFRVGPLARRALPFTILRCSGSNEIFRRTAGSPLHVGKYTAVEPLKCRDCENNYMSPLQRRHSPDALRMWMRGKPVLGAAFDTAGTIQGSWATRNAPPNMVLHRETNIAPRGRHICPSAH